MLLSPLKYAGNKAFLADRLKRLIESELDIKSTKVLEPFSGSLGFSLGLGFKYVHANDFNKPLVKVIGMSKLVASGSVSTMILTRSVITSTGKDTTS